jgi:hypothetical protein
VRSSAADFAGDKRLKDQANIDDGFTALRLSHLSQNPKVHGHR